MLEGDHPLCVVHAESEPDDASITTFLRGFVGGKRPMKQARSRPMICQGFSQGFTDA
jgi:hypothetical protein